MGAWSRGASTKVLADGIKVHFLDIEGRFAAETTPGSGERINEPNTLMLAAIMECPRGPLFFKTTGPASKVAAFRAVHQAWLNSFTAPR